MKTENKIIKLLIEEKKPMTIREMAGKIKADYRITYIAVQRLIYKNILIAETIGKSCQCKLNNCYYGNEIYMAEEERSENILKNRNIKQLYKEIMNKTKTSFFVFLLFGSYAKHTYTGSSDIDIMFISNDRKFEEEAENIVSLMPLKIHIFAFTEKEFISMKDSKERNVVKEAIENNIVLYGIENYYRLKNA